MRTIEIPDQAALERMLAEPGKHHLGSGLLLNVRKPGSGYWQGKYRAGGKERVLSIGKAPTVAADAAIAAWVSARDLMKQAPTMDGILLRVVAENVPLEPAETLPRMFTRVTYVEHWDCGVEGHSHRSRETAQQCIDQALKRATLIAEDRWTGSKAQVRAEWSTNRSAKAVQMRRAGKSFGEIGRELGVSAARASEIVGRAVTAEQAMEARRSLPMMDRPVDMLGIGVRAVNALKGEQIRTVGDLVKRSVDDLSGFVNLGRTTRNEILQALRHNGLSLSA